MIKCIRYDSSLPISATVKENISLHPDGFCLVEMSLLQAQYSLWCSQLPSIQPYYAVKSNPDPIILETLEQYGCSFDCASTKEIEITLRLGVTPDRILFANPVKTRLSLEYAFSCGVNRFTFDCIEELDKIPEGNRPSASGILRIKVDDSFAQCRLNGKFGAALDDIPAILEYALDHSINIIGVSFHVGSSCSNSKAFDDALYQASLVFKLAKEKGIVLKVLDIGGGFSSKSNEFCEMARAIRLGLDKYFRIYPDVSIIAEPGRFFCEPCSTLCMPIIGIHKTKSSLSYTLPEGLYHSFNNMIFDHSAPSFTVYPKDNREILDMAPATVFGPTCDSIDCLGTVSMPFCSEGDFLIFPNMGAYTTAASTYFNGFPCMEKVYV